MQNLVDEGKYKVIVECFFVNGEREIQKIYSNEFEIKGKINQPENYCEKDEDCILTTIYDGCCVTCEEKVVNKVIAAKEEQNRKKICDIIDSKTQKTSLIAAFTD